VHPPGGGTFMIEWQPKVARDASALAASLPDDGLEARQDMRALRAIDFFGDLGSPSGESGRDPLGTQLVTRFLAFLRALAAARKGQGCTPCRLTIITRHAALDVRAPREALLWGVGRTLGRDLDPRLGLDVRLVDVGGPTDLPMLGWLARHDVRERALAIRKGRLHAPRLVRRPGTYATGAASG
jgi:hypothetical protein